MTRRSEIPRTVQGALSGSAERRRPSVRNLLPTWAFFMRADDGNRTRTVSLGICGSCSNKQLDQWCDPSMSARERPCFTGANGPLMARRRTQRLGLYHLGGTCPPGGTAALTNGTWGWELERTGTLWTLVSGQCPRFSGAFPQVIRCTGGTFYRRLLALVDRSRHGGHSKVSVCARSVSKADRGSTLKSTVLPTGDDVVVSQSVS